MLRSFRETYRIDDNGGYPENYQTFIQNQVFQLLSLDVLFNTEFTGGFSCLGSYDFYDMLLGTTLLPTGVLALIALRLLQIRWNDDSTNAPERSDQGAGGRDDGDSSSDKAHAAEPTLPQEEKSTKKDNKEDRRASNNKKSLFPWTMAYYVWSFSLVPVSTVVFQTFSCSTYQFDFVQDEEEGARFETQRRLRADLRLDCDAPTHVAYEGYAVLMMALYPFGLPMVGAAVLYVYRAKIVECQRNGLRSAISRKAGLPHEKEHDDIAWFKNLFVHYRPEFFAWGIYDILNRLLLTGFAVLFQPGKAEESL